MERIDRTAGGRGRAGAAVASLALAALSLLAWPAHADSGVRKAPLGNRADAAQAATELDARVIVQFRASQTALDAQGRARRAAAAAARLDLPLAEGRTISERMQVLRGSSTLGAPELARRLATLPDVEWAEPDRRRTIRGQIPSDPLFPNGLVGATPTVGQWFLRAPDASTPAAIDAVAAWRWTLGSPSITVAVLDTGVRFEHPDLAGKLWPGYDFISKEADSNDGDGRDADASDPGDWNANATASCAAEDSSWHGTQVAGLIGAASDNGIGGVGVGRGVMLLPVRVLGRCGGWDSDIVAAMRWSAGLAGSGAPTNPHPAQVLNLSLGYEGACTSAYRTVMGELTAAGVTVVAAAGNETGHAVNAPANCPGIIAVAGLRHAGSKVGYSNLGSEVAIAAPAGNCVNVGTNEPCLYPLLTTTNTGLSTPGQNIYSDSWEYASLGTSFATPLVSGSVALMVSVNPTLTPSQVRQLLQSGARPFPTTGYDASVPACRAPDGTDQLECICTTTLCGAGMLDAGRSVALAAAASQPLIQPGSVGQLSVGSSIALQSAGSAPSGQPIAQWSWEVVGDAGALRIEGPANGPSVVLTALGAGTASVRLTVSDAGGQTFAGSVPVTVRAPVDAGSGGSSGGGGGGALGWPWLAGLLGAGLALGRRPR